MMQSSKSHKNAIFLRKFSAMAIGNLMEWFDFSCFGALIDVLAANFFPSDENHSLVLLKTLAVFGAAFVMRPIGGILMGWIGDTLGRKRALEISILLMLFPSFLIGCLPNYETAGWFSAGALVLFRLLQGLAAGGELVGAFLYTLEATDGNTKGFWGGACKASGNLGTTIGLALITLLRYVLTKDQLYSWGWRIPFWLGLLFGTLGVYARSKLKNEAGFEGEEFEEAKNSQLIGESPVKQVLREDWREIIMLVLVVALWGCAYYTTFIWLVYYLQDPDLIGGNGTPAVWIVNLFSNILLVILLPFGGWFGDYLGDRMGNMEKGTIAAMKLSIYFLFIVLIPSFLLFMTRDPYLVWFGQTLLVFPIACFGANLPAFMVSRFPVALRFSGVGIGYNIAHAIFSSTAPIVQTALILQLLPWDSHGDHATYHPARYLVDDSRLRPAYYLIFISFVAYCSLTIGVSLCDQNKEMKKNAPRSPPTTTKYVLQEDQDEEQQQQHIGIRMYLPQSNPILSTNEKKHIHI